jgi:hypothetical protein
MMVRIRSRHEGRSESDHAPKCTIPLELGLGAWSGTASDLGVITGTLTLRRRSHRRHRTLPAFED